MNEALRERVFGLQHLVCWADMRLMSAGAHPGCLWVSLGIFVGRYLCEGLNYKLDFSPANGAIKRESVGFLLLLRRIRH